MSLDYSWQKLHLATLGLATGNEPVQKRLAGAFINMHTLKAEDFPEGPLRDKFMAIEVKVEAAMAIVSANPQKGEIAASIEAMSDSDADQMIREIMSLYDQVCRRMGKEGF
ncbi:MAG: hypothetical protein E8D45_07820 [Nitrospira sp.]|nr:MAG: hypothetical protein E8D45_07820 [Nitrospira sp.]